MGRRRGDTPVMFWSFYCHYGIVPSSHQSGVHRPRPEQKMRRILCSTSLPAKTMRRFLCSTSRPAKKLRRILCSTSLPAIYVPLVCPSKNASSSMFHLSSVIGSFLAFDNDNAHDNGLRRRRRFFLVHEQSPIINRLPLHYPLFVEYFIHFTINKYGLSLPRPAAARADWPATSTSIVYRSMKILCVVYSAMTLAFSVCESTTGLMEQILQLATACF